MAKNELLTARSAVDEVRQNLASETRGSSSCPNPEAMKRSFGRYKFKASNKRGDTGLDMKDPLNIIIPEDLENNTILDEVIVDRGEDKRVLAFCTSY